MPIPRFRKKVGKPALPRIRLVPRKENKPSARPHGQAGLRDLYAHLLAASWKRLMCVIIGVYLLANLLFALAYLSIGNGIENARPGSFADAFFFSVQTLATIGYGKMAPSGLIANLLVTVEALSGFVFFALMTGLIFAKFSRPTARLTFSNVAVVCPYNGMPHLMLRIANDRGNRIVDATIQLTLLRLETTKEGMQMRRFYDLLPVRSRVPLLQLTWSIMHLIDNTSPLYGMSSGMLCDCESEIIVTITGLDETLSQIIHARYSYVAEEIIFDAVFEDILHRREDGKLIVSHHLFHKFRRIKKENT